ncbi:MAG: UTP--glucose-1-phosphate uridylyltransferase [Acidobacteria bacterium]|nr:UTP--glucose-1-phosphate uridylyltransferase [Acidobacteriota bacterium]MYF13816.1 UTP--glucose-1-phosphate uridylyltransferase [Acidobacteriota bacterium]MYI97438.1 UTP--glucose-1-phosphate uridylyltransferase [Acidobacteriota bacterium]
MSVNAASAIEAVLRRRRMPAAFRRGFLESVRSASEGPCHLPEATLGPATEFPVFRGPGAAASEAERARTVAITLNGGLGTTMGMRAPKALLYATEGMTFLDIALKQAETVGVRPVLMNSFATDAAIRETLGDRDIQSFLQHVAPKLRRADFRPVRVPDRPDLEWCPPGHGDLYTALGTSGVLADLLRKGFRYAFVSNVDNVGGCPDPSLLACFIRSGAPFLMEVVRRTPEDWKGGHLARRRSDGRLVLRETAQCAPGDRDAFRDHERYCYFNANNLWLRLEALREALDRGGGFLPLPTIANPKTADPRDPGSEPVFHLEQAAGTALEVFDGAQAIEVPRRRFAPVKTTENLLVLRSDIYAIDENGLVEPAREPPPVELDGERYRFISDLEARFPHGPPSLLACDRFRVSGDVRFGREVACEGEVTVVGRPDRPAVIPDGARLRGVVRV